MSVDAYPLQWPDGHERTRPHTRERSKFGRWDNPISMAKATRAVLDQVAMFTRRGHRHRINPQTVVISSNVELRNDGLQSSFNAR